MARQANVDNTHPSGSPWPKILGVTFLLPVFAVLLPSALFLGVAMLPTCVAYIVDRSKEKYLAITIGSLNFCGALPGLVELWSEGHSLDQAFALLGQIYPWLAAYGAAAVAWLIDAILPPFIATFLTIKTEAQVQTHHRRQLRLRQIWGEDVAATAEAESGQAAAGPEVMGDAGPEQPGLG